MDKEILIDALLEKGWFTSTGYFSDILCQQLRSEMIVDEMKPAAIGKGERAQLNVSIRTDRILWINENLCTPAQKLYLDEMNKLKELLNRELFLGIRSYECHYAHYSQSGFYKKHLDQHATSSQRILSTITYLNTPSAGGELIIYNKNSPEVIDTVIRPQMGTFVCFLSNQIYHEVQSTNDDRYSLTGWLRSDQVE